MVTTSPLAQESTGSRSLTNENTVSRTRIGAYAALGATASAIPLPWVPDSLARRVRGAIVHDAATRHGLSLTADARAVLSEPSGPDGPRSRILQAVRYIGTRAVARALTGIGPLGLVWPLREALRVYTLGHLFDRYLSFSRTRRSAHIDADEARRVRQAIDGALLRAVTVDATPLAEPAAVDDQRDAVTALIDALLGSVAGVPDRLVHRLEVAFDDVLAHAHP